MIAFLVCMINVKGGICRGCHLYFCKGEFMVIDGKKVADNLLKNIDSTNFYGQKNGKRMMYQKQIFK